MWWLRNNTAIDTSNGLYETVEIADRRYLTSSYFRSVLIVKSVAGALGHQQYTCRIQNTLGSDSDDVLLQRDGN